MKVSFTGSQSGMILAQRGHLLQQLKTLRPSAFIHGGCVGADDEADELAAYLGIPRFVFGSSNVLKSVSETTMLARVGSAVVFIGPRVPPLQRNPKIVDAGDLLIAAPKERAEVLRSGTWTTVRLARRAGKQIVLLLP